VVIDRACRSVSTEEALDYVRGYTCLDDVTAIDWGDQEDYGVRTKGMDTFCPVGPVLQTETGHGEPTLDLTLEVNGDTVADSNTDMMIFGVAELISHISQFMTLEPGDLIAAGAPPQNTVLEPDDSVAIDIEGVGLLEHDVA
jgi:2-keto-4-pentenoate hydratase/2-oxohepta-3-ene-1,7-dioic acid hydratase in catechol pathway